MSGIKQSVCLACLCLHDTLGLSCSHGTREGRRECCVDGCHLSYDGLCVMMDKTGQINTGILVYQLWGKARVNKSYKSEKSNPLWPTYTGKITIVAGGATRDTLAFSLWMVLSIRISKKESNCESSIDAFKITFNDDGNSKPFRLTQYSTVWKTWVYTQVATHPVPGRASCARWPRGWPPRRPPTTRARTTTSLLTSSFPYFPRHFLPFSGFVYVWNRSRRSRRRLMGFWNSRPAAAYCRHTSGQDLSRVNIPSSLNVILKASILLSNLDSFFEILIDNTIQSENVRVSRAATIVILPV